MNIIFGEDTAKNLREKNTILEIDTISVNGSEINCYAVLTMEDIPLAELPILEKLVDLHDFAIRRAKSGQFEQATDALVGLKGKFGGALDEFYTGLEFRFKDDAEWQWPIEQA